MNRRPSGYEPDELPDCSTPRQYQNKMGGEGFEPSKLSQQIYSLPPLTTRESTQKLYLFLKKKKADDRTRTDNLLITSQLLCQLSHIGVYTQITFNCVYYIIIQKDIRQYFFSKNFINHILLSNLHTKYVPAWQNMRSDNLHF